MANKRTKSGSSNRFYSLGLQNHCRRRLQPWNAPWKESYTNLDSTSKNRHHFADKGPDSQGGSRSVVSDFLQPHGLSSSWISTGHNMEWVAIPLSRESSYPRDWIQFSYILGGFFTIWATREGWLVNAVVLPVVMYRCESWTIRKAECWRIDAFKL